MNRLEQKCVIVSAGFHLLLALILMVGPGFLVSSDRKSLDMAAIDCIPARLIDEAFSGGGNPKAAPPPPVPQVASPPKPAPTPPAPKPEPKSQPEKASEPDLPKPAPKPKSDEPSLEPVKDNKPRTREINTKLVVRSHNTSKSAKDSKAKAEPATDPRVKQMERARHAAAELLASTGQRLRDITSSSTSIDTNFGPGGGGEAYANYGQVVKSIYEHAWIPPDDTASDDAITKVTVTIACDGKVISAHIVRPSGDASVDRSVQRTLDRVTFIAPFPAGAKDKQRTYTINFNLKAKRLLG